MNQDAEYIKQNLEKVRERIARAAAAAGTTGDIRLIAVTKTMGVDRVNSALEAGVTDVGENRVQELCEKYDAVQKGCRWHLIGHLQTNKVKYIVDKVAWIHSVDSLRLAEEIHRRAEEAGKVMNILVQVNVAEEESKFGIGPREAAGFIRKISTYTNIKVGGLMTVAPLAENTEQVRWVFKKLREIFIDIKQENIDNIDMKYLSMGMSNDFEVAIEEGANMVRIGTAIFGKRPTAGQI